MWYLEVFKGYDHAAFSFLKFLGRPVSPGKAPRNVAGGCATYYQAEFLTWHKWWVRQGHAPLPYYSELVLKRITSGGNSG